MHWQGIVRFGSVLAWVALSPTSAALPPAPAGAWECWSTSSNPTPCNERIYDLSVSESGDGWAVGEAGVILRLTDGHWSRFESPTRQPLKAVALSGPNDGWAVGGGPALRWDGRRWANVERPSPGSMLLGVAAPVGGAAWAVGLDGLLLKWDGNAWTKVASGTNFTLRDVAMSPAGDGWAVGDGVVLRFDGRRWAPFPADGQSAAYWSLVSVTALAADDAWAVGAAAGAWGMLDGIVSHWDGTAWSPVAFPDTLTPNDLAFTSPDDGWMVGGGAARWNGRQWTSLPRTPTFSLAVVAPLADGSAWAAADGIGALLQYSGQAWHAAYQPVGAGNASAVEFLSRTDGWAVGPGLWHWDGTTWSRPLVQLSNGLNDIAMINAGDGWAVGQQLIVHWDGAAWSGFDDAGFGVNRDLLAVDMVAADDGWAVGYTGAGGLMLHWDGQHWLEQPSTPTVIWTKVDLVAADDGWAAGYDGARDKGVLAHWDGQTWSEVNTTGPRHVSDLAMTSAQDGWLVGQSEGFQLLRYDGQSWSEFSPGPPIHATALAAQAPDDVWLAGMGTFAHWDGVTWTGFATPADCGPISDLALVGDQDGWAVGGCRGTLLRWSGRNGPYRAWLPAVWR